MSRIVFTGTFAMAPKSTMRARALPLARALVAMGHTVTIVLPPWDNPADSGQSWEDAGVSIVNVALPPHAPLVWYPWLAKRLLRAVLDLKPDVVHAFKPKGFSAFVARTLLRSHPEVRVVVDTDDWEGDGGWNDVERYPWWQKRVFASQERWLLRHAPAVTCASLELVRMAAAVRGADAGLHYLPNGAYPWPVPAPGAVAALRASLGLPAGHPVVLLYTRFVECGPERFVRLLHLVAQQGVAPTVLLVGAGLHGEEEAFRGEAQRTGLPLPVVEPGWAPVEALPAHLALADAALFPMADTVINRTKCSVKLIDLLSAGLPVVAEAVGQNRAYIEDGVSGVLTPAGDDAALAMALAALLEDPERRSRLGAAARARMQTAFGWQRVAAGLPDVYAL